MNWLLVTFEDEIAETAPCIKFISLCKRQSFWDLVATPTPKAWRKPSLCIYLREEAKVSGK